MVEITGNTFSVREQLRALGGRPIKRGGEWVWLIPDDKAEQARALVASRPSSSGKRRAPRMCAGCRCRINYGVYCGKCEFGR